MGWGRGGLFWHQEVITVCQNIGICLGKNRLIKIYFNILESWFEIVLLKIRESEIIIVQCVNIARRPNWHQNIHNYAQIYRVGNKILNGNIYFLMTYRLNVL